MRLTEDARRTAVFLSASTADFDPIATGFLLTIWDHGKHTYLVTAKHCALDLEPPFSIRVNTAARVRDSAPRSREIVIEEGDWIFHDDPNVDVGVFEFPHITLDHACRPWSGNYLRAPDRGGGIGPGDLTYTVGLFDQHSGVVKNVPLVHTGHIASFSEDEKITATDWDLRRAGKSGIKNIEGYIVQCSAMPGLSGAPVFVRMGVPAADQHHKHVPVRRGSDITQIADSSNWPLAYGEVWLLGIWQGSWEIEGKSGKHTIRNPSGYGVVVPARFLYEILETNPMTKKREAANNERLKQQGKVVQLDSLPAKSVKKSFDATLKTMLDTPPDPRPVKHK